MTDGFPFNMTYTINFEHATAVFDLAAKDRLMLYEQGLPARPVAVDSEWATPMRSPTSSNASKKTAAPPE